MRAAVLARLATEVSITGFVLCALALLGCSLVRELGPQTSARRRSRLLTAPRVLALAAVVAGALALAATLVRLLATVYAA